MTRPEIEQSVRAVVRVCKGQPRFPKEEQTAFLDRYRATEAAGDFLAAASLMATLETALQQPKYTLLGDSNWDVVQRRILELVTQRTGCGYDFNTTILATPCDGEEHEYTCPSCGVQGSFRAPYFETSE